MASICIVVSICSVFIFDQRAKAHAGAGFHQFLRVGRRVRVKKARPDAATSATWYAEPSRGWPWSLAFFPPESGDTPPVGVLFIVILLFGRLLFLESALRRRRPGRPARRQRQSLYVALKKCASTHLISQSVWESL